MNSRHVDLYESIREGIIIVGPETPAARLLMDLYLMGVTVYADSYERLKSLDESALEIIRQTAQVMIGVRYSAEQLKEEIQRLGREFASVKAKPVTLADAYGLTVSARSHKRKNRAYNSARDRVISKPGYC